MSPRNPESLFMDKAMRELSCIPHSFWERIQQVTERGTPDVLGCIQGLFVALEFKRSGKAKLAEIQRWKLKQIDNAGGFARVVTPENYLEILEELKRSFD